MLVTKRGEIKREKEMRGNDWSGGKIKNVDVCVCPFGELNENEFDDEIMATVVMAVEMAVAVVVEAVMPAVIVKKK